MIMPMLLWSMVLGFGFPGSVASRGPAKSLDELTDDDITECTRALTATLPAFSCCTTPAAS